MTDCPLCKMMETDMKRFIVHEEDGIVAALHPIPAHKGHIIIFEKEHRQIITQVDDDVLARMLSIAKKLCSVAFDAFSAQGTNILIQNGAGAGQTLNHFCVHVIPRTEGDGIACDWQPRQADQNHLSALEQKLSAAAREFEIPKDEGPVIKNSDSNYLIRQLHRMP